MGDQETLSAEHSGSEQGARSAWTSGANAGGAELDAGGDAGGGVTGAGAAAGAGGSEHAAAVMAHWADAGPAETPGTPGIEEGSTQVALAHPEHGEPHAKEGPEAQDEEAPAPHALPAGPEAEQTPKAEKESAPSSGKASKPAKVKTRLGKGFDKAAQKSPTLARNITTLQKKGWVIKYGKKGGGSFCDKDKKQIVIDGNERGDSMAVLQTMAHETGHALYKEDPYVGPDGLTKKQYVNRNVKRQLKDEGEATIMNLIIRDELLRSSKGKTDIGVAGAQAETYKRLYQKYKKTLNKPGGRDKLRERIGNVFADKEHPSTDPKKTYRQYYAKPYEEFYDKHGGG